MRSNKAVKAFQKIARREGKSIEEVRREIQNAIDIGYASSDPIAQMHWTRMSTSGVKPTPEEVVMYLAEQVKKK